MSDRVLGVLAILMAGAMAVAAWSYAAPVEYEPVGPRAFPLLLASVMAICGGWLLVRGGGAGTWPRGEDTRRVLVCTGAIIAYALLFQVLGFIVATTAMSIVVGRVFGGEWKQCVAAGVAFGVALYLLFDKVLDVVLPLGILHWT